MFNKWAEGAAYFYLRQQTNKPGFTGTFSVLPGRSDQSSVFCGNGSCVLWLLSTAASRWYPLNLPGVCSLTEWELLIRLCYSQQYFLSAST